MTEPRSQVRKALVAFLFLASLPNDIIFLSISVTFKQQDCDDNACFLLLRRYMHKKISNSQRSVNSWVIHPDFYPLDMSTASFTKAHVTSVQ